MIPGSTYPDQWMIYGNHHDAWVNGAHDPLSGASSLLETARTLAELRKQGWQPKRTIVLALWDGEEFGLLGSTEWAEKHQDELARKAVVYINSDTNSKGAIGTSGSHTLEKFMSEVLRDLKDPENGKSLLDNPRPRRGGANRRNPILPGSIWARSARDRIMSRSSITSDVASLNLGFGGPNLEGVYHSIYDDPAWFEKFADPGFGVRRCAFAGDHHHAAAPGQRSVAALRIRRFRRHRPPIRGPKSRSSRTQKWISRRFWRSCPKWKRNPKPTKRPSPKAPRVSTTRV